MDYVCVCVCVCVCGLSGCRSLVGLEAVVAESPKPVLMEYAEGIMAHLAAVVGHPSPRVKECAASAVGTLAECLGVEFTPYFASVSASLLELVKADASTQNLKNLRVSYVQLQLVYALTLPALPA
jgi:hypothetical protein